MTKDYSMKMHWIYVSFPDPRAAIDVYQLAMACMKYEICINLYDEWWRRSHLH